VAVAIFLAQRLSDSPQVLGAFDADADLVK